ncbi:MAG TPA: hypothetical protein VKA30_07610, partial [Actinomycetota bacterium]|nr:hypothetical protein [Actinomycetota bacterium]
GTQAPAFPKFHTGWAVYAPSVGDLDGDGKVEVVTVTREGYLFAWRTPGLAVGNGEWWRAGHDEWNTGNYGTDTRPPGALRSTRFDRRTGVVRFLAPGDDWAAGRVSSYRVRVGATWLRLPATARSGRLQRLMLPRGASAIGALDDAGNLGPVFALL